MHTLNSRSRFALMLCAAAFWGCAGSLHAADEKTGWWPPFVPDVPVPAAVEPIRSPAGGESLVIEGAECAGISGFRADWDRPIPLSADGATRTVSPGEQFGSSQVAVWDDPAKPGAIAAAGAYVEHRLPFEKVSPQEECVSWKLSCTGEVETWLDQMALVPKR